MMYWYGTGMTGWGYAFMVFGVALPWIVLIVGGSWLTLHRRRDGVSAPQVLANRYARGELDEVEYRHHLAVLQGDDNIPNGTGVVR